jgi:hypothetical protein
MHVEIGADAALFPEKEYINGIAVAVQFTFVYISSFATAAQQCAMQPSS